MKVICAGLQKTGTKTLAKALRTLGYNVHDCFEQYYYDKELWDKVRDSSATSDDYRRVLENVDAVTDYPGCGFWEEILQAFPDAKVILTVRSTEDEWIRSVINHCKKAEMKRSFAGIFIPSYWLSFLFGSQLGDYHAYVDALCPGCLGVATMSKTPNEALLRIKYRQNNTRVTTVCHKNQLLVFNVKDGWDPLCKFLGHPKPNEEFPVLNVAGEIIDQIANGEYNDLGFMIGVKKEIRFRIGSFLIMFFAITCVIFSTFFPII